MKYPKPRKKRKVSTIKSSLNTYFSWFIRFRDSDKDGFGQCISCREPMWVWERDGDLYRWNHNAHAGHYYSRGASKSLYYDEVNVNLQCVKCNSFRGGANQDYAVGLVEKYGPDVLQLLYIKAKNPTQLKHFELEILESEYKQKVAQIKSGVWLDEFVEKIKESYLKQMKGMK